MLTDTCIKRKTWTVASLGPVTQLASKEHLSLLGKNNQMHVLAMLGLHIQGPNGPKAYMGQNIHTPLTPPPLKLKAGEKLQSYIHLV
jgi:hypothetical protein